MQLLTPQFIVTLLAWAVVGGIVALAVQFYSSTKVFPKSYGGIWRYGRDWQMLVFIMALFVVGGLGHGLITSLQVDYTPTPTRIPSALTVRTADGEDIEINFYWDVLAQDPVIGLDYGEFETGESSSLETWVRNEALIDVWLTLTWEDLIPADAAQYVSLDWDWVKLIDTWKAYPAEFSIVNEQLVCEEVYTDPIIIARAEPGFNYEISTNTTITASPTNRPESQIVFRYTDSQNYYFAGLGAYGYKAAIGRVVNGVATRIAQGGNANYVDVNLDQWYDVKVRVAGSTFTVYIDGEEICVAEDTSLGQGDIGLRALFSTVVWDSYVAVDAFDADNVMFEDYFVGPPLEVGTSRKVTFTVTSIQTPPDTGGVPWDFAFDSVIIAYDNPREIKYPEPEP